MRIATWNVNSIRTRVDRVVDWMVREDVDVLAMQEIKCKPEQFPAEAFEAAGYELAIHGFNQWNGVAIASRSPIESVETSFPGMPGFLKGARGPRPAAGGARDRRHRRRRAAVEPLRAQRARARRPALHLQARLARRAHRVHARRDHPPTPTCRSRSWATSTSRRSTIDNGDPTVIVGQTTHVSPAEREAFFALEHAGVTDVVRARVPEGLFTYWDYKQLRFPRNEGMRIDFILGSAAVRRRGDGCLDPPQRAQGHRAVRPRAGARRPRPRAKADDDLPMIFG